MSATTEREPSGLPWIAGSAAAILAWAALYSQLIPFAECVVSLLPAERASHLGESLAFFLEVAVAKVTDYAEIAGYGIASTPGIMVDGKVVHAGRLPKPEDLARWIRA